MLKMLAEIWGFIGRNIGNSSKRRINNETKIVKIFLFVKNDVK